MQSFFKKKIIIITIVFQGITFAVGPQFLSIPLNTSELVSGINPSIINLSNAPMISVSYGNWLADINVSSMSYDRSLFKGWGGLTFRYISINDLELRTERPSDEPLSHYSSTAYAFDAKYVRQFKFGLMTVTIRYLAIQLYDESANGISGDLSLQKKLNKNLNIGVALLNMGSMSKLYEEVPKLPFRALAGGTYQFDIKQIRNNISISLEKSSLVNGVIFRFSESVDLNKIQFSIGTQMAEKSMSLAGGINIKLGSYKFGYGVQIGTQTLGVPQFITLQMILPKD